MGILTIIDEELAEVRAAVGAAHNIPSSPYYVRAPGNLEVVVRQAPDRSNVPAVEPVNRMLEDFRPELVMVVGIAGGVEGRMRLGDLVVPDYLHYGDFRKLSGRGDHLRYFAYDQPSVSIREIHVDPARTSGQWRDRIPRPAPEPTTPDVLIGSLVAGEKVLGDPTHEEQRRVLRQFPDALAIDMESVGAARAIHEGRRSVDYNPRFLVVRSISDLVRGSAPAGSLERDAPPIVGGLLSEMSRITLGAAHVVAGAARLASGKGPGGSALENSDERALWRDYAASVAAAFASELVDRIVGSREPGVGAP